VDEIAQALGRIATVIEKAYAQIFLPYKEWRGVTRRSLNERHIKIGDATLDVQQFCFNLVERTDDVVERHVTVRISDEVELPAGIPQQQVRVVGEGELITGDDLDPDRDIATEGAFEVPEGAAYTLTVVAIDNGGNRSEPYIQELVQGDDIAPAAETSLEREPLAERVVE